MLESYKAKLMGNHLEWEGDPPDVVKQGKEFDVIVTLVENTVVAGRRPFGLAKGQFVVPDDFDDPLPEEILRDFEGR